MFNEFYMFFVMWILILILWCCLKRCKENREQMICPQIRNELMSWRVEEICTPSTLPGEHQPAPMFAPATSTSYTQDNNITPQIQEDLPPPYAEAIKMPSYNPVPK